MQWNPPLIPSRRSGSIWDRRWSPDGCSEEKSHLKKELKNDYDYYTIIAYITNSISVKEDVKI